MGLVSQAVEHRYKPGAAMLPEPLPFPFLSPFDVRAFRDADLSLLTPGIDYELAGDGTIAAGTIRTLAGWMPDDVLLVRRATALIQPVEIVAQKPLPASALAAQLDRQMLVAQEQDATIGDLDARALMVPPGEAAGYLPPRAARVGSALVFDANGEPVAKPIGSFPAGPPGGSDNTYSSHIELFASDPSRKSARLVGDTDANPLPDGQFNFVAGEGWVRQQAEGLAYGRTSIALPMDRSLPRTLAFLGGVDPFTTADQYARLQSAFEIASEEGYAIEAHADAVYRKDGPLQLFGRARFDGRGATMRAMSDGPQAIVAGVGRALAPGFQLRNLKLLAASTLRTTDAGDNGLFLGDQGQPIVSDFLIENVEVGTVDDMLNPAARGVGGSAFWFANARRGQIVNCRAIRSRADGFHVTHGCQDLQFAQPLAYGVGDDAFPVVSYVSSGLLCERILWVAPVSIDGKSRVCAVVGGRDVTYLAPIGLNSAAAGAYFHSEPSFDTYGVENCHVVRGTFLGPCQGAEHLGPNFKNAGIIALGRGGSDVLSTGEVFARSVRQSSIQATVRGEGPAITSAFDCQSEWCIRNEFDISAYDMATGNGFAVGGVDTRLRFKGANIGGLLGFVSPSSRGTIRIAVDCDGSRVAGTHPFNVHVYIQGDAVDEVLLTGKSVNGPPAFIGANSFDVKKVRQTEMAVNGVKLPTRDVNVGNIAYRNGWGAGGETPMMERNSAGVVTIGGQFTMGVGTAGTVIASRPDGFRNSAARTVAVYADDCSVVFVRLETNGDITLVSDATGALRFANVQFQAAT